MLRGDIDDKRLVFILRVTEVRRLKNDWSIREIPIHPELIHLGFLDFIKNKKDHELIFSDLRERGNKKQLTDLFRTEFDKVIDRQLPNARASKKTFHSFRTWVITTLTKPDRSDALNERLVGHSGKTVHAAHYLKDPESEDLLELIGLLPIVTQHLSPRKW